MLIKFEDHSLKTDTFLVGTFEKLYKICASLGAIRLFTGVIKNGGVKANIIPELTQLEYYARTPTKAELDVLIKKLNGCFNSAATATGCKVR